MSQRTSPDSLAEALPSKPIKTEAEQICEAGVQSISYFAKEMDISPRTFSRILDNIPFSGNYIESAKRSVRCIQFTQTGAKQLIQEVKEWKKKKESKESEKTAKIIAKDALKIIETEGTEIKFGNLLKITGESKGFLRKYWTSCTSNMASRGWFKISSSWRTPVHALLVEYYDEFIEGLAPFKETLREDMRRRTEKNAK